MVQNIWLDPHTIRPRRSNQKLAKPTTRYDQSRYPGVKKQNDEGDTNYLIGPKQTERSTSNQKSLKWPIRADQNFTPGWRLPRGVWQRRRVKQLLVADEATDLVCETLWPRLVGADWGIQTLWLSIVVLSSRCQTDLCNDLPLLSFGIRRTTNVLFSLFLAKCICFFGKL